MIDINSSNQLGIKPYWREKKNKWVKERATNGQLNQNGIYIYFFNFNIPAVKTCPNAPLACKKFCFALKHEKMYSKVATKRNNNFTASKQGNFVHNMQTEILEKYNNIKDKKDKFEIYIRIHESGDYYDDSVYHDDSEYFNKWVQITDSFKQYKNLHFMSYTKEIAMINNYLQSKSITLDSLNIKIVFSVLSGFNLNTNTNTMKICKNLQGFQYNNNALDTYTVCPELKQPGRVVCQMSTCHKNNNVNQWNKTNNVSNKDKNQEPFYINDYSKNNQAPICMNCLLCYKMSNVSKNIDMEVF